MNRNPTLSTLGFIADIICLLIFFGLTASAMIRDSWLEAIFWGLVYAWHQSNMKERA